MHHTTPSTFTSCVHLTPDLGSHCPVSDTPPLHIGRPTYQVRGALLLWVLGCSSDGSFSFRRLLAAALGAGRNTHSQSHHSSCVAIPQQQQQQLHGGSLAPASSPRGTHWRVSRPCSADAAAPRRHRRFQHGSDLVCFLHRATRIRQRRGGAWATLPYSIQLRSPCCSSRTPVPPAPTRKRPRGVTETQLTRFSRVCGPPRVCSCRPRFSQPCSGRYPASLHPVFPSVAHAEPLITHNGSLPHTPGRSAGRSSSVSRHGRH